MATTRLYSPDIECESCEAVLRKAFSRIEGVERCEVHGGYVEVVHGAGVKEAALLDVLNAKGYRASLSPTMRPRMRDRMREFLADKEKYAIERRMLRYAALTLALLLLLGWGALSLLERTRPGVISQYGAWAAYLAVSVVALGAAVWHLKAYRTSVTMMTGMMIGMTIGMQTGMLIGSVLGATNGFFTGAMAGMLLGVAVGASMGSCCGIMGVLEGMMAGIMGGTMGAMISVMMFTDHIHLFMPVFVLLNVAVLAGFSYMLFEELVEGKEATVRPRGLAAFALSCAGAFTALLAIMLLTRPSVFMGG